MTAVIAAKTLEIPPPHPHQRTAICSKIWWLTTLMMEVTRYRVIRPPSAPSAELILLNSGVTLGKGNPLVTTPGHGEQLSHSDAILKTR